MKYFREILLKNKGLIFCYLLLGIACSFLTSYKADYFQRVIDGLAGRTIPLGALLFYGAVLMVSFALNYLDEYPDKKLENGVFLDFKLMALRKISRMDYQAYRQNGTGVITQRIDAGAQAGRNLLCRFWLRVLRQLLPTILFSLWFIRRIDARIAAGILAGYLVVFAVTNLLLRLLYRMKERVLVGEERLNRCLVRGFLEMPVFRLERRFPAELRQAQEARDEVVSGKVRMNLIHEAFFTIFALLVALLDVGVLWYVWRFGTVTVGEAVALLALIDSAYTPIAIFNVLYVQYKLDLAAWRRFRTFLEQPEDLQLQVGEPVEPLKGGIEIRDLSFDYGEHPLFRGVCLTIAPGERTAFVGESGSGKSTLAGLIAGLLKYQEGSIRLDGQELRELSLDSLYRQLRFLSQDAPVFDGTVRENLALGGSYSDEALLAALERAGLTELARREQALEQPVGERGALLSGGEKQRLALARLFLESRPLVILDEATSAMDHITEAAVMQALLPALEGSTVIAVAHRLRTVADFDRIVVFREGRIVGEGSFEALMADCPYFRALWEAGEEENIV